MAYSISVLTSEGDTDLSAILGLRLAMTHTITARTNGSVALPAGFTVSSLRVFYSAVVNYQSSVWIDTATSTLKWSFATQDGSAISIAVIVVETT